MQPGKSSTRGPSGRDPSSRGRALAAGACSKGRAASGGYARRAARPYGKRSRRRSRPAVFLKAAPCRRAAASAAARSTPGRRTPPKTARLNHGKPRDSTTWALAAFTMLDYWHAGRARLLAGHAGRAGGERVRCVTVDRDVAAEDPGGELDLAPGHTGFRVRHRVDRAHRLATPAPVADSDRIFDDADQGRVVRRSSCGHSVNFPGLRMPWGSRAALMRRVRSRPLCPSAQPR